MQFNGSSPGQLILAKCLVNLQHRLFVLHFRQHMNKHFFDNELGLKVCFSILKLVDQITRFRKVHN